MFYEKFVFLILLIFCDFIEHSSCNSEEKGKCGKTKALEGKIYRGNYTSRGQFPWVAVLMKNGVVMCGGSLLTNDLVLTAAHCLHGKDNTYLFSPEDLEIVLGAHNLKERNEKGRIFTDISKIEIHENWNITTNNYDADIAMLTLAQIIKFSIYIQPICLIAPDSHIINIVTGKVVGHGATESNITTENTLKFIEIPIVSDIYKCLHSDNAFTDMSSNRTFCAGLLNGSSVCNGDSGNGLFVLYENTYYLRGIVSASLVNNNECDTLNYAVFTNVAMFYRWIQDKIRKREELNLFGSHFITPGTNYTSVVNGKNFNNYSSLNISIKSPDYFDSIYLTNFSEFLNEQINFEIPFSTEPKFELKISYSRSRNLTCVEQSVQLINLSQRPLIFINLNKAIYKALDHIKFQFFVLNHKLVPFPKPKQIDVMLIDSNNQIVNHYSDVYISSYGVYEDNFTLPENPNFGTWKLQVKVGDKIRSKKFRIQEYDKKVMQVDVKIPKEISFYDKQINMSLNVKHPIKDKFRGFLTITVNVYSNSSSDAIIKNKKFFSHLRDLKIFRLHEDLNIPSNDTDCIIKFQIEIEDKDLKLKSTVNSKMIVRKDRIRKITLKREKYFRPGQEFKAIVEIKTADGLFDNSLSSVDLSINYNNSSNVNHKVCKILAITNGGGLINISPLNDTTEIEIKITVESSSLVEKVELHPSSLSSLSFHKKFISVNLIKQSYEAGFFTVHIQINSSTKFNSLLVLVSGPNGIVYSMKCVEAKGLNNYELKISLPKKMKFKASLIAIDYLKDGKIIYDSVELDVDDLKSSSYPFNINFKGSAVINQPINFLIESKCGSKVYLSAIEKTSAHRNGLSLDEINSEVLSFKKLKFQKTSNLNFDNSGLFVLQPLKNVDYEEILKVEDEFEDAHYEFFDPNIDQTFFIPEVWFDGWMSAKEMKNKKYQKIVPPRKTSFEIQGISIHPTKGLSVTSLFLETTALITHSINIQSPSIIHENEIFQLKFHITNLVHQEIKLSVKVKVENGEFKNETNCDKINQIITTLFYEMSLSRGTSSRQENIFIQSRNENNIKVVVETDAYFYIDDERIIKVKPKKRFEQKDVKSVYINTFKSGFCRKDVKFNWDKSNIEKDITIYGNLLDPLIGRLDEIFTRFRYKEFEIDMLTASTTFYKFFKATNQSEIELVKKVFEDMEKGKNDVQKILQSEIKSNNSSNIRLIAYAVQTLIDIKKFLAIDEELIKEAARFIMNHQNPNGSFPYDKMSSYRVDIGSRSAQVEIQTAIVILPFLINRQLKQTYKQKITRTLNYLDSFNPEDLFNDHEKVQFAYAFAVSGDFQKSKKFLNAFKSIHKSATLPKLKSYFAEIIATLIITKVQLNENPYEYVEWLIGQRNHDGGFYSPHSTVLALKAFYEFTKYKNFTMTKHKIVFNEQTIVNVENYLDKKKTQSNESELTIIGIGSGLTYVSLIYKKDPPNPERKFFNVTIKIEENKDKKYKINIGIKVIGINSMYFRTVNFMIIEMEIPSGYELNDVKMSNEFQHEYQKDRKLIIIHAKNIKCCGPEIKIEVFISHKYEVFNQKPSTIIVYDYYRQNIRNFFNYKVTKNERKICA